MAIIDETPDGVSDREADDLSGGGGRRYASLNRALTDGRIPLENHAFIARMTSAIGIDAYYERSGYIKAVRKDGGVALEIHSGWTNGFRSGDEIVGALGDVERWRSGRGTELWGVTHPIHGNMHGGSGSGTAEKRDYGTCPVCTMKFSAQGTCGC